MEPIVRAVRPTASAPERTASPARRAGCILGGDSSSFPPVCLIQSSQGLVSSSGGVAMVIVERRTWWLIAWLHEELFYRHACVRSDRYLVVSWSSECGDVFLVELCVRIHGERVAVDHDGCLFACCGIAKLECENDGVAYVCLCDRE